MSDSFLLRVHCEDIPLGSSGGVEGFALGMIGGFSRHLAADSLVVLVAPGARSAWLAALGNEIHVKELPPGSALPSHPLGRMVSKRLRSSRTANRLRSAVRGRLARTSDSSRPIAEYYPFHRVRSYGKHRFVTVHDLRVFTDEFADRAGRENITTNVREAAAIFCSWRHPFVELSRIFPAEASKIFEVPFPPMLDEGGPPRHPGDFLLYPAATSPHKNHSLLLQFATIYPNGPPIICVGPEVEPEISRLRSFVAEHHLGDRLQLRGMVDPCELQALYAGCLAVVMPTKYEAASGPVMEAFCRGIPVVASRIASIESQIDQVGAGVSWFDPDSVDSLAEAIARLDEEYDDFVIAAEAGSRWYSTLSWEAAARSYLEVIAKSMTRVVQ